MQNFSVTVVSLTAADHAASLAPVATSRTVDGGHVQRIEIKQVLRIATAPHDGSSILCRCPGAEARVLLHWSAEVEAWVNKRGKIYQPTHWLRELATTSYINYSAIDITRILGYGRRFEGEHKAMARAEYTVVRHEGRWTISYAANRHGPYKTKRDAIRFAVDAANKAGELGYDAQVLSQKRNKTTRIEWTFGSDSYPLQI